MKDVAILFVDDEPINRLIFGKTLEQHIQVYLGESGEEGLQLIEAHPEISVVITDFSMPEMSGLEFVDAIKARWPDMPCFTHSAVVYDADIDSAIEEGKVRRHFPKPLALDDFLVELGMALEPTSE